jgi:hypothetical protein
VISKNDLGKLRLKFVIKFSGYVILEKKKNSIGIHDGRFLRNIKLVDLNLLELSEPLVYSIVFASHENYSRELKFVISNLLYRNIKLS